MKDIIYKEVYTRKVDREYNNKLMEDCKTSTDIKWDMKFEINPINMYKANDQLVKDMTNLTEKEIDELSVDEYDDILDKIKKIKSPSKK